MRNLKYAILGLVNRQPMTGYDIKKAFEDRALSSFWHAEHSQIYPELKKLVDEGSLEFSTGIKGEKMETKTYTITEAGRADFIDWLKDDVPVERTYKDIFRLRTFNSDQLDAEDFKPLLQSQLKQHTLRRDRLVGIRRNVFKDTPPEDRVQLGDYMVLYGAILRENAYLEWLEDCIRIFEGM